MKTNRANTMSQEYERINKVPIHASFKSAALPENINKNRYMDIFPIEDTRVPLANVPTDYINANFVNISNINCICTQAPLHRTFKDFWLMVYQQNASVVCALNRHVENKVVKGESYWPEKQRKLVLGDLTLKLEDILRFEHLSITLRRIIMTYQNTRREIYHLHYEGWPDFGVPESSLGIRELVRLSIYYQKLNESQSGPLVIHCSAGIGRSGSFMAIASVMSDPYFKQLQKEYSTPSKEDYQPLLVILSQFKISNLVISMRQQRHPGMVQTSHQYKFIYMALMDEIYHPSIVSETISRAIQWQAAKKCSRLRLSKSGPIRKSFDKKGDYDGFLVNQTSNDLSHLFKRMPKMSDFLASPCGLSVSDSYAFQEERAFLCKSGPLVMVL